MLVATWKTTGTPSSPCARQVDNHNKQENANTLVERPPLVRHASRTMRMLLLAPPAMLLLSIVVETKENKRKRRRTGSLCQQETTTHRCFPLVVLLFVEKYVIRVIKHDSEAQFSCKFTRKSTLRELNSRMTSYKDRAL